MEWTTHVNQWVKRTYRLMGVSEAAASSEISLDDLLRDSYIPEGSHLWYEKKFMKTAQLKSSCTLRAEYISESTHQDHSPEHFVQGEHRRRTKGMKGWGAAAAVIISLPSDPFLCLSSLGIFFLLMDIAKDLKPVINFLGREFLWRRIQTRTTFTHYQES